MKVSTLFMSLIWLSGARFAASQDVITVCSEQGNATCVAEGNRVCLNINGVEPNCGKCLNEYVEFREQCLFIDDIDSTTVDELIEDFMPHHVDTVSNEIRAEHLKAVARDISFSESDIPPREYQLGLGKYSLDTEQEALSLLGYVWTDGLDNEFERFDPDTTTSLKGGRRLQDRVDWVEAGAMTPVKDQGRCGCCWAVAPAAAVESAAYLTGTDQFLESLSFQQLISCDDSNSGCSGGNIVSFFLLVSSDQHHLKCNLTCVCGFSWQILGTDYIWKNEEFSDQGTGGIATLNDWEYTGAFPLPSHSRISSLSTHLCLTQHNVSSRLRWCRCYDGTVRCFNVQRSCLSQGAENSRDRERQTAL